jgi:hypothetical protein
MDKLCEDILTLIFSFIPYKSLKDVSFVCKKWYHNRYLQNFIKFGLPPSIFLKNAVFMCNDDFSLIIEKLEKDKYIVKQTKQFLNTYEFIKKDIMKSKCIIYKKGIKLIGKFSDIDKDIEILNKLINEYRESKNTLKFKNFVANISIHYYYNIDIIKLFEIKGNERYEQYGEQFKIRDKNATIIIFPYSKKILIYFGNCKKREDKYNNYEEVIDNIMKILEDNKRPYKSI